MIALGETGGAAMSEFRRPLGAYAASRIAVNGAAHGLVGSAEYDAEVRRQAVFAFEAGLSFFHTHAEGLGLVVLFVSTVTAAAVPWRTARGALHVLVAAGGLFPLGYLGYAVLVLERGRDAGIELAERSVLTPLGSAMILGVGALATVLVVLVWRRRRT
jgi:hypothetical protein